MILFERVRNDDCDRFPGICLAPEGNFSNHGLKDVFGASNLVSYQMMSSLAPSYIIVRRDLIIGINDDKIT